MTFYRSLFRHLLIALMIAMFFALLPLTVFTAQENVQTDTTAESSDESLESTAHDSVASCLNVPYGTQETSAPVFENEDLAHFSTPPNPKGTTLVDIGLYIEAITDIDPVTNTFVIEGFMDMIWCDSRESFDPESLGWHEKFYLEEDADEQLNAMWWPDPAFVNQSGARDTENLELIIYEDGTVEYEERFAATLETTYDLFHFPFDSQQLYIEVESLGWSDAYLVWHEEGDLIGFREGFELAEWHVIDVFSEVRLTQEVRQKAPFSEFILEIDVQRQPGFYIFKIILPMLLIVALSWSVFWMEDTDLHDRLGVSFTGILTVVAYQFIVGDSLPKVSYVTYLDAIMIFSFVMMVLTIVQNVIADVLKDQDNNRASKRIDHISRVVFPMVYVAGLVVITVTFGIV